MKYILYLFPMSILMFKNEQMFSDLMKKCQQVEVYVLHDVRCADGEKDEEIVEYRKHGIVDDIKNGYEKETLPERKG